MIYKNFKDIKISNLVLGCMRLPTINNNDSEIDQKQVFDMVDYAINNGINYFDTAWGYHCGNSEIIIGKALARHDRNKFFVADKFPGYDSSNFGKVEEIFNKQLEKMGLEYFDFYLFHDVCEPNLELYLDDEKYKTASYLKQQKEKGRIKHLGCSIHSSLETMKRFIEKYEDIIEFCQIQLNYIDYDFQDAKLKIDYLNEHNIPIWVMEPVRGGKLVNVKDSYMNMLKPYRDIPAVEWAFRFVQGIKGVTAILSGMSNMEQLKQNIEIFNTDIPTNKEETNTLLKIGNSMTSETSIPCTSCRYCTSHCPVGIDIPEAIKTYNEDVFTGGGFGTPKYLSTIEDGKKPFDCIGCRSCEEVCPQQIKIQDIMSDFAERIRNNPFV